MEYKTDAVLDIQGNAVFNASVRVLTESRQLATVYNSSGAQIPNPVSTDKTGEFSMAMPNGKYYWEISVNGKVYETKGPVSFFDSKDEFVSVKSFGAVGDGVADDTAALNAAWQYVRESFVDVSSEDYVTRYILLPPGVYKVSALNWTGLKARNVHVIAWGAVVRGNTSGKNVIDMTGTRWAQIHGLTVFGPEAIMPRCGILIGPEGTTTNGNNYFNGVNVTGHFAKTALWNIGSETTSYVRSRFANYNTDPAAVTYIADGRMRQGATSDFQALRAANVPVSFTNNQFYSCDLRNMGGGSSVWMEYTRGWGFDRGCYFISFNAANFQIYVASNSSHQSLSIEGLMESAITDFPTVGNTGCKYQLEFIGDGTNTLIEGFVFKVGVPLSCVAVIKGTGTGNLAIKSADIVIGRNYVVGTPVFSFPSLSLSGRVQVMVGPELNLANITSFNGSFSIEEGAPSLPVAGAYTLTNAVSGRLVFGGSGPYTQDGVYRAEGVATDVNWKARAKGDGDVELGNATKTDAFKIDIPPSAVHGLGAYVASSGEFPYYGVQSATAVVSLGVRSKGAGSSVLIGNDVEGNSSLRVWCQSTFPRLLPDGDAANIDLQLEGKGTGAVRFGTLTANADAAITGYITIKDASGTLRKLAVIS